MRKSRKNEYIINYTKNRIKLKGEQKYIRKSIGLLVRKTNKGQKEKSIEGKKASDLKQNMESMDEL